MPRHFDADSDQTLLSDEERKRLEHDSLEKHRHRFQRDTIEDGLRLCAGEARIGMVLQGSANEDHSPNLPILCDYAKSEGLEVALVSYLRRVCGLTDEQMQPAVDLLGRVLEFPSNAKNRSRVDG